MANPSEKLIDTMTVSLLGVTIERHQSRTYLKFCIDVFVL